VSILIALSLTSLSHLACRQTIIATITADAGEHTRIDTPVSLSLAGIPLNSAIRLEEVRGDERFPVRSQIERGACPKLCWVLSGTTPAGTRRVYRIIEGKARTTPAVKAVLNDRSLEITAEGAKVLRYNHAPVPPPEGVNDRYIRSAFIHPLWSPSGEELTRIHPPDHVHHMGLWNPWTKTEFEGRSVDFWNLGKGEGTVRFVKYLSTTSGPVFGGFRALQAHVDLTAPGGEKTALNEIYDVRVWNPGKTGGWICDFTTTQSCASSSPLTVLKYRYGGFGFRAAASWNKGDYLTSEGLSRDDGHGTRARWCIVHGPTARGPAGVVFMSHPRNRDHPEPMRIWNQRPEIFFNFCPVQKEDWKLEPGGKYILRYRLYIYDGTVTQDEADRFWNDYANPPGVTLEIDR